MEIKKDTNYKIDQLEELMMSEAELLECKTIHTFFPGIYRREIFMPAGSLLTSRIHKTAHPYFVMTGKLSVFSDNDGQQLIEAPFVGETRPAARRVLYIHEDCLWITTHAIGYITGDENGWDEERKEALIDRIEKELMEERISEISGMDLHLEYEKKIKKLIKNK